MSLEKTVRTVVAVAVLVSAGLVPALSADDTSPAGEWKGAIEIPSLTLEVVVDLSVDDDGVWSGEIDIPAQSARDLPLGGFEVDGASVTFRIEGVPGEPTFSGSLSDDGATLSGEFTQAGQIFPFALYRPGSPAAAGFSAPTPAEALEGFDDFVEDVREAWNIPAVGIAVVAGGETILARGYGLRDVENALPADESTVFAIGSASKAFTAMVVGQLVDDGPVSWDEPVTTYLPKFDLEDELAASRMTPRDLLCHRSGLPRHDLIWYGAEASREDLLGRLPHLAPTADFRTRFQYQNLMFMTAGHLAGRVAGSTWESLVRERIFEPLGMSASSVSLDGLLAADNRAIGYREDEVDGEDVLAAMDYRNIDTIGPAGSINSTPADMARWVLAQLGGGAVDGARIVEATTLAEMHRPHVVVDEGILNALFAQPEMPHIMYGLGWFVQPYRGHEMIHHGGNIDGFSTLVAFLPNNDAGVVVLTNRNGTLGTSVLAFNVVDRLLGLEPVDWSARFRLVQSGLEQAQEQQETLEGFDRRPDTAPSHDLEEYAGRFRDAGYGIVEVTLEDDGLAIGYNALESALEHWHYDTFRLADEDAGGIRVSFHTDAQGYIGSVSATLQAGVDPIVFERLPAEGLSERAYLEAFVGEYELGGRTSTFSLGEDGVLTLTVPGQPRYTLEPVRQDEFRLADLDGYSVRFLREDGAVTQAVFIQPNGVFPATRR